MKKWIVWGMLVVLLLGVFPVKEAYAATEATLKEAGVNKDSGSTALYKLVMVPVGCTNIKGMSNNDYIVIGIVMTEENGSKYYTPVVYRAIQEDYITMSFANISFGGAEVSSYAILGQDFNVAGDKDIHINLTGDWTNSTCSLRYKGAGVYSVKEATENLVYAHNDTLHKLIEDISVSLLDEGKINKDVSYYCSWLSLALCIQCLSGEQFCESDWDSDEAETALAKMLIQNDRTEQVILQGGGERKLLMQRVPGSVDVNGVVTEGITFSLGGTTRSGELPIFSKLLSTVWSNNAIDVADIIWSGESNYEYNTSGELVKDGNNNVATLKTVPKLAQLIKAYAGLDEIIQEELNKQNNSDSKDTVTKYEITDDMTEFEKWSVVFTKAIAGQDVGRDNNGRPVRHEVYYIENFWNWCNISENADKLTKEEILRLQAFYNIAAKLSGVENIIKVGELLDNDRWNFEDNVKPLAGENSYIAISRFGYNLTTLRNNAVIVGKDTKFSYANNSVLVAVMNNFLDISRYYAVQIYGVKTKADLINTQEEEDIQYIDRNNSLETILNPENLQYENSIKTGVTWSSVPECMSRLRTLDLSDDKSYEAYKTLQYALMLANTYACNSFYSGIEAVTDEEDNIIGYENEAIEEYRQKWDGQEVLDAENSMVYTYALAYTQILKGFEYLGVDAFSPQLEALLGYANWLKGIVDANDIDLSGRIDETAEPLSNFFSVDTETFSYNYNLGVALSASYIPMQTNMYDVNSLAALDDANFVEQFHYPYGFFRKALYIDTDTNAAVNLYVSGKSGNKRVATLGDLLECERDIVLYVDENFYNVDTLAELQNFKYNKVLNTEDAEELTEESFLEGVWTSIRETFTGQTVTADELVKTGGYRIYSDNARKDVTARYTKGAEDKDGSGMILSSAEIDEYMTGYSASEVDKVYNEYTPLQGFAVVSAIYKKIQLYSTVASQTNTASPVFISSPDLAGVEGVTREYWNSLYSYLMLKNLPGNMSMDYKITLDIDSPIYMDIYGNILTESGLVVVPAAANPTLQNASSYDIHTAAFLTLADNSYYEIPKNYNNAEKFAAGFNAETGTATGDFILDEASGTYQVAPKKINGIYYNFRDLPIGDRDVLVSLVNLHKQRLATNNNMKFDRRVYIITEVLRGAPLEWIDKQKEGLNTTGNLSKGGVYTAAKLEEISDTLLSSSNGNSLISFPNLAFMEHYEVIIMFLYKILFAGLVALMFVKIYMDVVQRRFGLKSIASFLFTIATFVIVLYAIPEVLNISYYITNKVLLQDEAISIAMLNLEKRNDGQEIGVTSVRAPETKTVLYLKMDDVDIAWYEAAGKVLNVNSLDTMQEIYEDATADSVMAQLDGTVVQGNAVYMDIDTVFDATKFEYDSKKKQMKNVTVQVPYASYITPYYAILDCLVARVNEYNKNNDSYSFTTVVQSKGAVRTRGLVQGYFTSLQFMEQSQDPSTLFAVYGLSTGLIEKSVFTLGDLERMKKSLWYSDLPEEEIRAKLNKLNDKAREFIANNHTVIGKVSDETFLKVMALYLAIEHNKLFRCQYGNALELFDVDTRDIMRLSITNRADVLGGASKSFARFVYDEAGGLGTVATLLLVLVYFIMSIVKPVMVIIILATMLIMLGIRKLFKRDQEHVMEGFLISVLLLCGTNILYALMLKLSMLLPRLGLTPFISVFAQIFVQIVYGGLMYLLLKVILQDWKNLGYVAYSRRVHKLMVTSATFQKLNAPAAVRVMQPTDARDYMESIRRAADNKKHVTKGITGADILARMQEREKRARKEEDLSGKK